MKKGLDYTGITVSFRCHDGEGNIVMHRRSEKCRDEQGCWDFGGGGVKFNESLEDALIREVKEEYRADILESTYIGHKELFREYQGMSTHWISFIYLVKVNPQQVENGEPDKIFDLRWVTLDDLPDPLHSQIPDHLDELRKWI